MSALFFCFQGREENKVLNEVNIEKGTNNMMFAIIAILFLVIVGFAAIVSSYEKQLDERDAELEAYQGTVLSMERHIRFLKNELEKAKSA